MQQRDCVTVRLLDRSGKVLGVLSLPGATRLHHLEQAMRALGAVRLEAWARLRHTTTAGQ